MQLVFSIICGAFVHSSSSFSLNREILLPNFSLSKALFESNGDDDEPIYQEPNDFDLSLRLKSHQSSLFSGLTTQQYKPDDKRRSRVIWVIDDEESILDAVGSFLISSGYQVVTFLNATAPMSLLQENRIPDAIVCDVLMPEISGIDFLSFLRRYDKSPKIQNIPFILLTAKGRTEDRIRGYDAGTDGYLMKPFDPEELVAMIDRAVERKNVMQSDDESVTVEQLRKDLGEVKELLTKKEGTMLLQKSKSEGINNLASGIRIADEDVQLLSKDEINVILLLAEGYMNKEIASELQYSTRWVERHLTNMFRKTNCASRTELVRWAVANGYVNLHGKF
jgi:DNA-binding NarL/FixJ family response regulator